MYITAISDTHTHHDELCLLGGDILIHAGDLTYNGKLKDLRKFMDWFAEQSYTYKIFIAGNHDWGFEGTKMGELVKQKAIQYAKDKGIIYLEDSGVTIKHFDTGEDIKIWGSPVQPRFGNWAFNRDADIQRHWNLIPEDTNILITHGPAGGLGMLSAVPSFIGGYSDEGCQRLRDTIDRRLKNLKYHIFGHIHEGHGTKEIDGVNYINASFCGIPYRDFNDAIDFKY